MDGLTQEGCKKMIQIVQNDINSSGTRFGQHAINVREHSISALKRKRKELDRREVYPAREARKGRRSYPAQRLRFSDGKTPQKLKNEFRDARVESNWLSNKNKRVMDGLDQEDCDELILFIEKKSNSGNSRFDYQGTSVKVDTISALKQKRKELDRREAPLTTALDSESEEAEVSAESDSESEEEEVSAECDSDSEEEEVSAESDSEIEWEEASEASDSEIEWEEASEASDTDSEHNYPNNLRSRLSAETCRYPY